MSAGANAHRPVRFAAEVRMRRRRGSMAAGAVLLVLAALTGCSGASAAGDGAAATPETTDSAAQDVQAAIAAVTRRLPAGMPFPPTLQKVNPADQPILNMALHSPTLKLSEVNEYAETLVAQRISMINGVAQVNVMGDRITASGQFVVRQSDYGIKPVSIAGGTLKLKDEIELSFDIVARAAKAA